MNPIVKDKKHRFTVITDSLIRIEQDSRGKFEDRPTTAVINRNFSKPQAKVLKNHNGHELEIITPAIHMYYDGGDFAANTLYADIKKAQSLHVSRWFFGTENAEGTNNLKGTVRTLDRSDGEIPLEDGIMSRDGYSFLNDSDSFVYSKDNDQYEIRDNKVIDGYLFAYGHDYQKELTDYYNLTGFTPLIPRFALGNWWSRYYPYHQDEYLRLMEKFDEKKIPLSVCVFDMDWHRVDDVPSKYGSSWTGFSWNKKLFPDHKEMLNKLHQDGKRITLNLHPADGIRAFEDQYSDVAETMKLDTSTEEAASFNMENPLFRRAYFKNVLHPLQKEGVDFWWIDWQQGNAKVKQQLDPLWLLNHYQFEDICESKPEASLILSRYAGPGSHRYPLGFSGDTIISWKSLAFQPYFTSTAANIGYTWWSHDIGGHMGGKFDGELSTRWLQLGVFSPINRLHSSNNLFSGKEPWNYRIDYERSQERFLRLRNQIIPIIDTANYLTHKQGVPLVKPLYYDYPEEVEAYRNKNEFIFASEMLVSPIVQPHDSVTQLGHSEGWLPDGEWVDYFNHLVFKGKTKIFNYRSIDQMPVFVRKGSVVVTNPNFMEDVNQLPEKLQVEVFPGNDGKYELIEHQDDKVAITSFKWDDKNKKLTWTVEDEYKIIPFNRRIDTKIIKYRIEDVFNEFYHRLQVAKISYELKQKLYQEFNSEDYQFSKFVNILNELDDQNLRCSLNELAYSREAYHE